MEPDFCPTRTRDQHISQSTVHKASDRPCNPDIQSDVWATPRSAGSGLGSSWQISCQSVQPAICNTRHCVQACSSCGTWKGVDRLERDDRDDRAVRIVSNTPKELRLIAQGCRVSRLPWDDDERVNFTLKGLRRSPSSSWSPDGTELCPTRTRDQHIRGHFRTIVTADHFLLTADR